MPAIVKAQTTKQAKAAYKARGRPTLSDKESRQLQRAIQLEERAEKAREAEKRRTEAAKKRAEKERPAKGDARLGSQRRTDKFGFVASQFHLGNFFGKPRMPSEVAKAGGAGSGVMPRDVDTEDEFGSEDLDDDTLLKALDSPEAKKRSVVSPGVMKRSDALSMPPPPRPVVMASVQARVPVAVSRSSGMAIAPPSRPSLPNYPQTTPNGTTKPGVVSRHPAALMPPPPRPFVGTSKARPVPKPIVQEDFASFWDELDSSTQVARDLEGPVEDKRTDSFCSGDFDMTEEELDELMPPDLGFTSTQLETFIDDDIQLSQAVPA
ncbi:uncharacterized protein CLAFUR5_04140 [Fulvia fulva]|uniref:Uncharacterized protein n=1 Tax=Passalora fulva TaxID=5499 RepID=A0A9Q8LGB4_PASFU|nr:uncharacterized protein CLAFUR5_04140 [Fulvia fulva]UJO16872.1 hypothetical protein CLAFUR5_04140 [Fulvia fulva]